MKHVQQDKYNVAWFTLAECIARGEKVRAMGVYRLLAHSIDDRAFARQLEGDILLAFDDINQAKHKYAEAALMYSMGGKFREAVAVYEHLHDLDPDNIDYCMALVDLYQRLNNTAKNITYRKLVCKLLIMQQDVDQASTIVDELDRLLERDETAELHQQIIFALLRRDEHSKESIIEHLNMAAQGFMMSNDHHALQKLVASLEVLGPDYAQYLYKSINGIK